VAITSKVLSCGDVEDGSVVDDLKLLDDAAAVLREYVVVVKPQQH
jgi:hypothetical protein